MAARRNTHFSPSHRSTDARSVHSSSQPKIPVSLAKRLLFPQLSPGVDLPSLLNTDDPQLNAELYDFLALTLRGFVNPWWTKITKYDKEFLQEITRVVAIFLRSIEARLARADLTSFVFRDVPTIVSRHYSDYRNACAKLGTSYATGGSSSLPHIFHQLQPHMAVSSNGHWNETYIQQAVEHVMKACMPPEDWEAEVERVIVREILAQVVLKNLFSKLSQPWFIQKLLLDILDQFPVSQSKPPDPPPPPPPSGRLSLQFIIVCFLSTIQTISGFCLTAITFSQKAISTIHAINSSTSFRVDPRYDNLARPVIDMMAEILTMRSRAAASSVLSLVELAVGFTHLFVDRALPYLLYNHVITTSLLANIVARGKTVLFPNGYPEESPPDPTLEEQILLRDRLETRLLTLLPTMPAYLLSGPDDASRRKMISSAIDPLTSSECNVHLLIFLFDAILLTVFPDLGTGSGLASYAKEHIYEPHVI